jgi:hypothetical protein
MAHILRNFWWHFFHDTYFQKYCEWTTLVNQIQLSHAITSFYEPQKELGKSHFAVCVRRKDAVLPSSVFLVLELQIKLCATCYTPCGT